VNSALPVGRCSARTFSVAVILLHVVGRDTLSPATDRSQEQRYDRETYISVIHHKTQVEIMYSYTLVIRC
jgi:hypothetical protein